MPSPVCWRSRPRIASSTAVCVLALCFLACEKSEPPVATLGVAPERLTLGVSEVRTVRLSWEIVRPLTGLSGELRVLVHVLQQPGEVLRTFDHAFPQPWSDSETVEYEIDLYQSALGPPLPSGEYTLSIGLYDEAGKRWPLEAAGENIDGAEYAVARLEVTDETSAPMFRFSESWAAVEPGLDRQILGRRWLTGAGSIFASEVRESGTLWLKIWVPPVEPGDYRLVLDPGYQRSRVLVRSDCGESEIELTGEGHHELDIPIELEEQVDGASECEIAFEPNFHLLTPGSPDRRTIQLEMLAWQPTKSFQEAVLSDSD